MNESASEMIRQGEDAITTVAASGELSIDSLIAQVAKVQEAMKAVMKSGEHYGIIPGTEKPTLLKPGAEKLCLLFRLDPQYQITRTDHDDGHLEYEVICTLYHIPTGQRVGSGVGFCSSRESKYRYRRGNHSCPTCGEETIIKGKAEYGGGWLCWRKKGGCGAKFGDGEFGDLGMVENPDIADTFNTILKMSKKRAMVDATLTATAASDIFTQDLEDMRSMLPKPVSVPVENSETPQQRSSRLDGEAAEWATQAASTTIPPEDAPSLSGSEMSADDFWKIVNDHDIDRKVAMDALRDSGGDFSQAMKDINNVD